MFNRFPNVLLGTLILLVIVVTAFLAAQNNAEVEYRLSFPAPEHRWLEGEVLFSELSPEPPCISSRVIALPLWLRPVPDRVRCVGSG